MRLLLDEMFSAEVARQLRARGHDVQAVVERELRSKPDAELLAIAHAERRALVTENIRDFRHIARALLVAGGSHAGLVYAEQRRFPRGHPRTLGRLVTALEALLVADEDLTARECWLT